ncbi:MAG TPA: hypothetical protein VEQ61_01095, partial [Thermoleophilaceae bacterium]|nr:hypothetical protein [Thermoleophilaceae bacterium]
RSALRAMSQQQADDRASGRKVGSGDDWASLAGQVLEHAGGALAAGVDPASTEAGRVVNRLAPAFASVAGEPDGPEFRASLAGRISSGSDPRAERYWQLLGKINGWPEVPSATPAWEWLATALAANARQRGNRT